MKPIGRLESVDLRELWMGEASDFTPWLAQPDNIQLLSETIGLQLEVQSTEEYVGSFRADILCHEVDTDRPVLIENQLEKTDHNHLGQLLTYAAGLDAVTLIWLSKKFTDEHRAALDWLNEKTDESVNIFGLEIEVWRIGDSPWAPKFNIVCQPNNWTKTVKSTVSGELSETRRLQLEFWTQFGNYMSDSGSFIKCGKPQPKNWANFALGRPGIHLTALANTWDVDDKDGIGVIRALLYIEDRTRTKEYFARLESNKSDIEKELGETLTWDNPVDAIHAKAYLRRSADITDRSDWPSQHQWLREKLEKLHKVFAPRVRNL